jgi:DNA-binding IclR family transcriptional regulator
MCVEWFVNNMQDKKTNSRKIAATETSFAIIEAIKEVGEPNVTNITDQVNASKGTVHTHLSTLVDCGYVYKEGSRYHLSLRFLDLGAYARSRTQPYKTVKPLVTELAEATNLRVQYMVEERGYGIHVYRALGVNRAEGERAIPIDARIGKRRYLHACAAGKAMLAYFPESRTNQIIDDIGLPAMTEKTITEQEELFAALETIKERGYSFNKEESVNNIWAIGAPIRSQSGAVIGGLSISGPTHQVKVEGLDEEQLPNMLLGTIDEIELKISARYDDRQTRNGISE